MADKQQTKYPYQPKRVLEIQADLGEAPAWSIDEQALFWVDILKSTINRFDPVTGENRVWALPSMPGCFALREGNGAVIAANHGLYDIEFNSGRIAKLQDAPFDPAVFRFNDGKSDRQGRLWVGSILLDMSLEPGLEGKGTMYRYDGTKLTPGFAPISIPNGVAFSPDGRTMYRAETRTRVIYARDYDPLTGVASRERVFARVPEELGHPDGATVDSQGGYWSALPVGAKTGGIARFTPDGVLDLYVELPVFGPTMPAFGGPTLSTLYITSGRLEALLGMPVGEMSGDLFAMETPFRGIPETKFRNA